MAMRRESNARMADFAVADVSLFWLLNALNSAEPVLSELHQEPSRHPELLYRELARLAGSLLTFSLEHHLEAIPLATGMPRQSRYSHRCLPCWIRCSKSALPSRVIAIALEQGADREIWRGRLHDARLREGGGFLSVGALFLPPHQLQSRFPQLCKAGSHDDVAEVVNIALSGIAIKTAEPCAGGHSATSGKPIFRSGSPPTPPARCWRPATAPSIPRNRLAT